MAKYDLYRSADGLLLLDCQANLLSALNTRLVVPLLPRESAPPPLGRLNPVFDLDGQEMVMATQFASAVAMRDLVERVGSLEPQADAIGNALDMLLVGF